MEGHAFARFAFDGDFPLVRLDGFLREEQFQPRFFTAGTPGAERMEDVFPRAFFQAGAVVLDGEADVRAGRQVRRARRRPGVFKDDFDAAPAFGQPLPSLQTKVEDGLVDLRVVGVDLGAVGVDVGLQLDLGGDDGAQNLDAFLDDGLEAGCA